MRQNQDLNRMDLDLCLEILRRYSCCDIFLKILPRIYPFSTVIMDNVFIHHVDSALRVIRSAGAKVIFLPPHSPDLNPLEPVFGKVKTLLKENDAAFQASSSPKTLLTMAFEMITQEDCVSYARHCGYM